MKHGSINTDPDPIRRKMVIGIPALAAGTIAGYFLWPRQETAKDSNQITQDPNSQLIAERQKTLDDMLVSDPCSYFEFARYDHYRSLESAYIVEAYQKYFDDPVFWKIVGEEIKPGLRKNGLIESEIESTLNSREFRSRFLQNSLSEQQAILLSDKGDLSAATLSIDYLFGKGYKSPAFFYPSAFEKTTWNLRGHQIDIPANIRLHETWRHECFHAINYGKGIDFGNGLVLDSAAMRQMRPEVVMFLLEDVTIANYHFFRDNSRNQLEVVWAAGKFGTYTKDYEGISRIDDFNPVEYKFVRMQIERMNKVTREIESLFDSFLKSR